MEQRDLAELFLVSFIQSIAQVSKRAPEIKIMLPTEKSLELEKNEKKLAIEMLPETIKQVQSIQPKKQIVEINSHSRSRAIQQYPRLAKLKKPELTNQYLLPQNTDINQRPTAEKLNFLIKDPAVTEIECMGSDQTLLVKKAGIIQKTHVKLSIEEIYQLIAEFSQKTKIPVIDGTLKAALNNLILTAVLSEILGPRFILQKKNPFQQLVPN